MPTLERILWVAPACKLFPILFLLGMISNAPPPHELPLLAYSQLGYSNHHCWVVMLCYAFAASSYLLLSIVPLVFLASA